MEIIVLTASLLVKRRMKAIMNVLIKNVQNLKVTIVGLITEQDVRRANIPILSGGQFL